MNDVTLRHLNVRIVEDFSTALPVGNRAGGHAARKSPVVHQVARSARRWERLSLGDMTVKIRLRARRKANARVQLRAANQLSAHRARKTSEWESAGMHRFGRYITGRELFDRVSAAMNDAVENLEARGIQPVYVAPQLLR
ncbi:hypothetical protein [Burkholderia sp. WAC0059]|uniref:hypothetical protein n=1 Tax=Burkholderia sp. WAC0059 TaxID=2066022 RepID=UPI0011AF408F|nr:hypothetical protein [Burkholderia sp. WAC0059]